MPRFCEDDFLKREVREKLHVITMSKFNKYPLTDFNTLSMKEKRVANEILNEYVKHLPEHWETKLTCDFNLICQEEIFNNPKIDFTALPFRQKSLAEIGLTPVEETDQLTVMP
jgi:hypothetical protein